MLPLGASLSSRYQNLACPELEFFSAFMHHKVLNALDFDLHFVYACCQPLEAFSMPLEPQLRRSSMVMSMEKSQEYA